MPRRGVRSYRQHRFPGVAGYPVTRTAAQVTARTAVLRSSSTAVIVNPAAGRGGIRASLPGIREAFTRRGVSEFHETTTAGEEAILAQRAIAAGARAVVAVGGD